MSFSLVSSLLIPRSSMLLLLLYFLTLTISIIMDSRSLFGEEKCVLCVCRVNRNDLSHRQSLTIMMYYDTCKLSLMSSVFFVCLFVKKCNVLAFRPKKAARNTSIICVHFTVKLIANCIKHIINAITRRVIMMIFARLSSDLWHFTWIVHFCFYPTQPHPSMWFSRLTQQM